MKARKKKKEKKGLETLRKTYQSAFYIKFILVRVKCRAVKVLVKICNALCFFPCLFLIDWLIDTVKLVYFGQQWIDGYGSKLLSVCHSKLATDPILWITMTHQECSRCICWNLGWLPVGEPRQCPRHLTCVLARPHVIECCQIHQRLLPSLFILDSLPFLLNKLPMSLQILSIPLHLFFTLDPQKGSSLVSITVLLISSVQPLLLRSVTMLYTCFYELHWI